MGYGFSSNKGRDDSILFFFLLLVIIFCNSGCFDDGDELLFFFLLLVVLFFNGNRVGFFSEAFEEE